MRKTIALTLGTLMLVGCEARATDSRHDDAVYRAVLDIMCSSSEDARKMAVFALADEIETYRPQHEDDTAGGSIQAAIEGYEDEGCASPARTRN